MCLRCKKGHMWTRVKSQRGAAPIPNPSIYSASYAVTALQTRSRIVLRRYKRPLEGRKTFILLREIWILRGPPGDNFFQFCFRFLF